MTQTRLSRRAFLKTGCAGVAAAGLAVCSLTALSPDPSPIETSSFTYGGTDMNKRILVAYASRMGSTVDVAGTIGEALGMNGYTVDVKPIDEGPQVEDYQSVLVGSAVQHGKWLPEAVDFVKANQNAINQVPAALFCVHIQNLGNDHTSRQNRRAYLDEVRPLVQPAAEGFFAGKFDRRGAALLMPGLLSRFVPTLDFRNWKKMSAWAESLQPLLVQ